MVLMRMRQEYCVDLLADQIFGIRADQVDPRRFKRSERHTEVCNDPTTVMRRPISIGIEVHADFVASPQGEEYQFVFDTNRICHAYQLFRL